MTPINPLQTEPGTRLSWVGGGEGATERKNPKARELPRLSGTDRSPPRTYEELYTCCAARGMAGGATKAGYRAP